MKQTNTKRINKIACFALITLSTLLLSGCGSLQRKSDIDITTNDYFYAPLVQKDYDAKGIVVAQTELEVSNNGVEGDEGSVHTALLMQAKKLGADAIINIHIDRVQVDVSDGAGQLKKRKFKYIGTATAIKYGDAIPQSGLNVNLTGNK